MRSDDGRTAVFVSRWRWWVHLILIGGYFVAQIPLAFFHIRNRPTLTGTSGGLLIVSAINLAIFAMIFLLGRTASRASREELLLHWRPGWWVVPLGMGYSVAARIALAAIVIAAGFVLLVARVFSVDGLREFAAASRPQVEKVVDVSAMQNSPAYFWLILTVVSFLVAGLREEMWRAGTLAGMRALWPQIFSGRKGEIAAVAIIALFFGAGHLGMGLFAAILAGILGLFFGIMIVVYRSIWPAVFAHGFFDAVSFAFLPYAVEFAKHLQ